MPAVGHSTKSASSQRVPREFSGTEPVMRLILVRHGQSANRRRLNGEPPSKDPGLSDLGKRQAEGVAMRLEELDLGDGEPKGAGLLVSSPMHRCLLTIYPAVQRLGWTSAHCLCHGGAFEYGCAGLDHAGSSSAAISKAFPEFTPVGFNASDHWDYRGDNAKENDDEFVDRGTRLVHWLLTDALEILRAQSKASTGLPVVVLCMHQTLGDLLCHLLLEGSAERFVYASIRYKMDNGALSELFVYADGQATPGTMNSGKHLWV